MAKSRGRPRFGSTVALEMCCAKAKRGRQRIYTCFRSPKSLHTVPQS